MFELQGGLRVMHWHGGDDWAPMAEGGGEHDVARHDPERAWLKGARIFRCTQCQESIAVTTDDPRQDADMDHPHPGV